MATFPAIFAAARAAALNMGASPAAIRRVARRHSRNKRILVTPLRLDGDREIWSDLFGGEVSISAADSSSARRGSIVMATA